MTRYTSDTVQKAAKQARLFFKHLGSQVSAQDVFFFVGLALMSYGAWLVYQPAGYILAGFALFILSVIGARRG